jgi:spore coat protein H
MMRPALIGMALVACITGCKPAEPSGGSAQVADPPEEASVGPAPVLPEQPEEVDPFRATWELPPLQEDLPRYDLEIPQSALDSFAEDPWAPEQPATFVYGDERFPVNVRLRGASARHFPKKSWNVDFEDLRFQGREELNLVAEYQDSTLMVEKWAYDIMQAVGVPAPRTQYVRVFLNGTYQGVYLDIEEVDRKFLQARPLPDDRASIYRAGGWDGEMKLFRQPWQGGWQKITNKTEPDDDLQQFLERINHTPEPELVRMLEEHLELDRYLRLLAAETVVSNNYVEDARNYWVNDRITGRWYMVPWDLNNGDARFWPTYSLGDEPNFDHPLFVFTLSDPWLQKMYDRRSQQVSGYEPTFSHLRTRIVNHPELRRRLLALVEQARDKLLDPAVAHPRIEQMHALIAPHMEDDPYIDQAKFANGLPYLQKFVSQRHEFVAQELARWKAAKPGLVIDAFDPAGGWVELRNRGEQAVSTKGILLTTYLRRPMIRSNVPAHTLAPGQSVRFTAEELDVQFDPQGEVGLFDRRSVAGVLDVLFYGPLPGGKHYARATDADGTWTVK